MSKACSVIAPSLIQEIKDAGKNFLETRQIPGITSLEEVFDDQSIRSIINSDLDENGELKSSSYYAAKLKERLSTIKYNREHAIPVINRKAGLLGKHTAETLYITKGIAGNPTFFDSNWKPLNFQYNTVRKVRLLAKAALKNGNASWVQLNEGTRYVVLFTGDIIDYNNGTLVDLGEMSTEMYTEILNKSNINFINNRQNQDKTFEENTKEEANTEDVDIVNIQEVQGKKRYAINYTKNGKTLQYTIEGDRIYNKENKEVYKNASVDRNKILAKLSVLQKRAQMVTFKDNKYIVSDKGNILNIATGKLVSKDNKDYYSIKTLYTKSQKTEQQITTEEEQRKEVFNSKLKAAVEALSSQIFRDKKTNPFISKLNTSSVTELEGVSRLQTDYFSERYINFRVQNIASLFSDFVDQEIETSNYKGDRGDWIAKHCTEIIEKIYNKFATFEIDNFEEYDAEDQQYLVEEYRKVKDNFKELLSRALDRINFIEKTKLEIVDYKFKESKDAIDNNTQIDSENEKQEDGETEDDVKDGWMIKARSEDPRATLSVVSRRILSNIKVVNKEELDENGNPTYSMDDLGNPIYEDVERCHTVLLLAMQNCTTSDKFIETLTKANIKYPWVKQILEAIEEDNNKEFPTVAASLYADLQQEYLNFYIIRGQKFKRVNQAPATEYLVKEWNRIFNTSNIYSNYSIYNNNQEYNTKNISRALDLVEKLSNFPKEAQYQEDVYRTTIEAHLGEIKEVLNSLGIAITEDELSTIFIDNEDFEAVKSDYIKLTKILSSILTDLNNFEGGIPRGFNFIEFEKNRFQNLANLLNILPENANMITYYEAGEQRYSFAKLSYFGKMMKELKNPNKEELRNYLETNFGKYKQYFANGTYQNLILNILNSDNENNTNDLTSTNTLKNQLERIILLHKDGKDIKELDSEEYAEASMRMFINSYYDGKGYDNQFTVIPIPILADAASYEYLRLPNIVNSDYFKNNSQYNDENGNYDYKKAAVSILADKAMLEVNRMRLVTKRLASYNLYTQYIKLLEEGNQQEAQAIYDSVDGNFVESKIQNFDGSRGLQFCYFPFLNRLLKENVFDLNSENAVIRNYIEKEIDTYLKDESAKFNDVFKKFYVPDSLAKKYSREELNNQFFYNFSVWETEIIHLLAGDPAFVSNTKDFYKRIKEIYAATQRVNTPAILEMINKRRRKEGKSEITSTTRKYMSAKDIEYPSEIKEITTHIFDTAVKEGRMTKLERDFLVSQYSHKVNATDGQTIISINGMRKVLTGSGKYTENIAKALDDLENNVVSFESVNTVFQAIKSFVRTDISIDSNIEDYGEIKVPVQQKHAEALMPSALLAIANTGTIKPPIIEALNTFMKKYDIDDLSFSSAIKRGGIADIDLNPAIQQETSADDILDTLENYLQNDNIIKEHSWEDYGIITATPEHGEESTLGSQSMKEITANLPNDITCEVSGVKLNKAGVTTLIDALLVGAQVSATDNMLQILKNNASLSQFLLKEMSASDRYNEEDRKAVTLNAEGDFTVPLTDATQRDRISALILSKFKKSVIKRETAGSVAVQISSVGFNNELQVRFKTSDGELLPTKREWLKKNPLKTEKDWKTFIESQDVSIAHYEVYLPAYAQELLSKQFADKYGNVDINKVPSEALKAIGLRIPTEAKYSMQPMVIKGFLPKSFGQSIMLPGDITMICGSDYDIKLYWYRSKNKLC